MGRKGDVESVPLIDSPISEKHVPPFNTRRRSNSIRKLRKGLRFCRFSNLLSYSARIFRLLVRGLIYFIIGSSAVSIFYALLWPVYSKAPAHYQSIRALAHASDEPGRANPNNTKIFIASTISDPVAIRSHWSKSLRKLVDLLGPSNVFVSIYENDSGPETPKALYDLSTVLPCNQSIVTGGHVKLADLPQIEVPSGQHGVKRSEYNAFVRNHALRPLDAPSMRTNATRDEPGFLYAPIEFDRVLFLDNIFFDPVDAVNLLLSTRIDRNGNASYEAACAADFVGWGKLHDAPVTRDSDGYELGYPKFPWFSLAGSGKSRADVLAGRDAVRVRSCWGGMTAYDAKYFQLHASTRKNTDEDSGAGRIDHIANDGLLRFRSDNELFWDASERCLLAADVSRRYQAIAGRDVDSWGIFLNPYIRVAHTPGAFKWLGLLKRFEHVFAPMQYTITLFGMYPRYNERRKEMTGAMVDRVQWFYFSPEYDLNKDRGRDGAWLDKNVLATPGSFCGRREMHVMGNDFRVNGQHKMKGFTIFDPPSGWSRGWH